MKFIAINRRQKSKAFTVLETAVVLMIVSLTFMTLSPAILTIIETAEVMDTSDEIVVFQTDIDEFF